MLNQPRFKQLYGALTDTARKVYEAVPQQDAWNASQVTTELPRLGYSLRDYKTIIGCLDTLKRAGLVTEPERGHFKRVPVKTPEPKGAAVSTTATKPPLTIAKPATKEAATSKKSSIDMLADLAAQMRQFATDLEAIALHIDDEMQDSSNAAQQLKQLKALLKGLD